MRTKILSIGFCYVSSFFFSQTGGGEFRFQSTECLSNDHRIEIKKTLNENQKKLTAEGKLAKNTLSNPLFIWPVRKSANSPYNEVWSISNYVDHNPNYPNQVQDYNCGTRTYDTSSGYNHAGVDIFTWPFSWHQMDNDYAEVIAAAPGTIIGKDNGNYDRNCTFNNTNWNAVYIQHSDGSVAWYGHLKNNSLTTKNIGESVVAGEYLGVVGSSGNSTGPHLHFEVYNSNNQLVDPYKGTCNTWTSSTDSWWENQKNYNNPKINAISTHSNYVTFNNGCGVQESTNYKNDFNPGDYVYFYAFLSDMEVGTPLQLQLIRPDNTVAQTSNFSINTFYVSSYWYWTFTSSVFNQNGNWKAIFKQGNNTVTHNFTYGGTLANSEVNLQDQIKIINPIKEQQIHINYQGKSLKNYHYEIYNSEGKLITKNNISLKNGENKIPFHQPKGVYVLKLASENFEKTFKILN